MVQINQSKFAKCTILVLIFAITALVFVNGIEVNSPIIAYGKNKMSSQSLSNTISHKTKLASVRITSPVRGQYVPVGKNLVVSGISASKSTSNCAVSVIVNAIKPYQNATAIGPKGQKDYSRWTFLILPKYTIKEGTNKIAAKISCHNKPSLVSYYTLNVTGLVGNGGSFSSGHAPVATTNNAPQIATPLP
ncbi:MAG TPA: hypothetical protein VEH06_01210 [Candidatus Bathyarchaeia archaeon]|nr:hypothetical protein [Candidatus Bathyarchaeia archaeon]